MKHAVWVTMMCGLIAYSCMGTETQNPSDPLRSFKDSGCKKERSSAVNATADTATASQSLVSTNYSGETAGLKCIAWEILGDNRTKIDLYNFEGACGAQWSGQAATGTDGELQLALVNPQCLIASCGWCIYDWSFEVEGLDVSKALSVGLGIDTCPGERDVERFEATLPIDVETSGILCNYANFNALGWQAMALTECGTTGMPCQGTDMCDTATTPTELACAGDLVCADNGNSDERICVKSCSTDEDCGSLGVSACTDGLCRPKSNW